MILYGSTFSPFVRKVAIYVAERGIEVEMRSLGKSFEDADPDFLACSPARKIPAMRDGDYTLADSSAIIHYLEAKHGASSMLPTEAEARGTTIWFEEYGDTILFPVAASIFFNRFVAPVFMGREGNAEVADKAEAEGLPPLLDYLEGLYGDGREWLVGDAMTIADMAVLCPFLSLRHAGGYRQAADYPALEAQIDKLAARPSVAPILAREEAIKQKLGV